MYFTYLRMFLSNIYVDTNTSLSKTLSLNSFFQSIFLNLGGNGFIVFVKILALWVVVAWLLAVVWVFKDSTSRYNNLLMPIIWFIVVLPFNLLGLLAYIILRPTDYTIDQEQEKLSIKLYKAELFNFIECPYCGTLNKRDGDYCTECGLKLFALCPKCNKKVYMDWQFCKYCGVKLEDSLFNLSNISELQDTENNIQNHKHKDSIFRILGVYINKGSNIFLDYVSFINLIISKFIKWCIYKVKQFVIKIKGITLSFLKLVNGGIYIIIKFIYKTLLFPIIMLKKFIVYIFSLFNRKTAIKSKNRKIFKKSKNKENKKNKNSRKHIKNNKNAKKK